MSRLSQRIRAARGSSLKSLSRCCSDYGARLRCQVLLEDHAKATRPTPRSVTSSRRSCLSRTRLSLLGGACQCVVLVILPCFSETVIGPGTRLKVEIFGSQAPSRRPSFQGDDPNALGTAFVHAQASCPCSGLRKPRIHPCTIATQAFRVCPDRTFIFQMYVRNLIGSNSASTSRNPLCYHIPIELYQAS